MSNPPGLSDSLALFPTDEAVPVALAPGKLPSYIADHRARLRARFSEAGAQALPDYELLELLLFRVIPRQDVKPLARRLLDEFGDIAPFYRPGSHAWNRFPAWAPPWRWNSRSSRPSPTG